MATYDAVLAGVTLLLDALADAVTSGVWSQADRAALVKSMQGLALQYYLLDEAAITACPASERRAAVDAGIAARAQLEDVAAGQNRASARRAALAAAAAAQAAFVALSPRAQAVAPYILNQMKAKPAADLS